MNIELVIMAAGLSSRFKEGLKQITGFGPNSHWLMDYALYDAHLCGFSHATFIVRKQFRQDIENRMIQKWGKRFSMTFVEQNLEDLPVCNVEITRQKPWGTGQALWCCKNHIKGPFAIINADDFYGKDAFEHMASFLKSPSSKNYWSMVPYLLNKTLSHHGPVSRGICLQENGFLKKIEEHHGIHLKDDNIVDDKGVVFKENSLASMNFWGFCEKSFDFFEESFKVFLKNKENWQAKEFLIPDVVKEAILKGQEVKILKQSNTWFGATYASDKDLVEKNIENLNQQGIYPENL